MIREGFCEYCAARRRAAPRAGIRTRYVRVLPGGRRGRIEVVRSSGAHAWIEVYFRPRHGSCSTRPGGRADDAPVLPEGEACRAVDLARPTDG
jgi:hypothetical protein